MIKNNLNDDKTRAIIHCDLLRVSWLNFKNSKDELLLFLKKMDNTYLTKFLQIFCKDFNEIDLIQEETNLILKEMDKEMMMINDILKENNAPRNIISADQIQIKFEWMHQKLLIEINKLEQRNGDFEDRLTFLQNENQQVHQEFKEYMNRTQSLTYNDVEGSEKEDLKVLKEKYQHLEERFVECENECLFLKSTVDELNQQISLIEIENKNLQTNELQNILDKTCLKNIEIQYKLDIERENNKLAKTIVKNNKIGNLLTDGINHYEKNGISITEQSQYKNTINQTLQINKLTQDLAILSDKYSEKRERHRQQLLEARSIYQRTIQEMQDKEKENQNNISYISEQLRITQLRLKKVTHEKSVLLSKIVKLENEVTNGSAEIQLNQEKIVQLEKQISWFKTELIEETYKIK